MAIDILNFKDKYMQKVKESPTKKRLTVYEVERVDAWAVGVFGDAEYAFMFDILIPNIEHALTYGYEYYKIY